MILSEAVSSGASGLTRNISNLANNLVVGYKFYVFIGPISLAFNKVSGIETVHNYEPLQVGGINDSLTFLKKPLSQHSTIMFEDGGIRISVANMKLCFNSSPKEVLVLLCTASGKVTDLIAINNAVVSKVNIGELDAEKSGLAVNNIEMIYTSFSRIPL